MKNANGVARGWIEKMIADFLAASPSNTMQDETGEPAWEDALRARGIGVGRLRVAGDHLIEGL